MFQTQFSKPSETPPIRLKQLVDDLIKVTAVRPAIWEEHCLECSAPQCFESCSLYEARVDGRCKRFENGIETAPCTEPTAEGCTARVSFKPWGNLLTIVYPGFIGVEEYQKSALGAKLGDIVLHTVANSSLPSKLIWPATRAVEYARRRSLRKRQPNSDKQSDAFVLHAYSNHPEPFNLILEVHEKKVPVFRTSFKMDPGENLHVINRGEYSDHCDCADNTVKIFPENDIKADVVFYWCHFVKGQAVGTKNLPDQYVKCLAWDLDNTLWDGILIESDDPDSLRLREGVLETIKELDRRGILQSIASKNDLEPAMAQLQRLGLDEYFLYPQISWEPKSASINQIADMLNINVDSLAFIDDSVFEREQVASECPLVRIFDETQIDGLLDTEPFGVEVTSESGQRRETYRAELVRKEYKKEKSLDLSAFIRDCEITITLFKPETQSEIDRCFELIQRTNQLNISGKKYSRAEFEEILNSADRETLAFSCKDRFGEYGIVCFGQFQVTRDTLTFLEFAMSCRVAGKHIENALLNYIKKTNEVGRYLFPVIKTPKNELMRRTLSGFGLPSLKDDDNQVVYDFSGELKNEDDVLVASRIQAVRTKKSS
ncbi:HAD-IIIC family phosphatase [Akkermansiaceae bacterium]|nr:HAD-IIIC family phosphatase [Akkermansiaceae bacterium]